MALQVWIPLNNNIENVGLNYEESVSTGTISYTNGLFFGKCFSAGSGSIAGKLTSVPTNITVSFWFKDGEFTENVTLMSIGDLDERLEFDYNENAYYWRNSGSGIIPNDTELFDANTNWNHFLLSADGTTVKIYLNGNIIYSEDQTGTLATSFGTDLSIHFGSKYNGTDFWNGYIQDARIYDHVLSTREVLDLAKGLALEYTFSHNGFGRENLLNGSEGKFEFVDEASESKAIEDDSMYAMLEPGIYTISAATDGTWTNVPEGDPNADDSDRSTVRVALELYLKEDDEIISRIFCDLTENESYVFNVVNAATYYVAGVLYGNGTSILNAFIDEIKIEEGGQASPWIPSKSDPMYTKMDIGTDEQDVSGYHNDGIISDPAPIWSNDTRMYSGSYDFSNGSYIESDTLNTSNIDKFTISIWAKAHILTDKILYGFSSDSKFNFSTMTGVFGIYDVENDTQLVFGEGTSVVNYIDQWHCYTITGNGIEEKLYIDDALIGTLDGYIDFGSTKLFINGWNDDTTDSNKFNGLLSDLRVYSIEFTLQQVKDMYHQKAAMDNTGKLFAAEFVNNSALIFSKTGIVGAPLFTTFNTFDDEEETYVDADKLKFNAAKITAVDIIES